MKSLSEAFPDLASQWDYEKNKNITPDSVPYGSHLKVWWKCPICGHSYQKRISNRTAPSKRGVESAKCPICLGRIIIPGYNSLKARYPEIIEKEWDFEKNTVDPDTIPPHYRKKVWWKCPNGHSYDSLPGNKVQKTGGNCPYCSSQKITRDKSLGVVNPELAKEWHPTKNGKLTPFDVFANCNKKIWWLCPICGHEWEAKCSNRNTLKRGCPQCAKGRSSSIPEQLMFRTIQYVFPDAINRHHIDNDEIDVYVPSKSIGFEYDGQRFHNPNKLSKDVAKSKRLTSKGIKLYRFREDGCPKFEVDNCKIISVKDTSDYEDLETKLKELLITSFSKENVKDFHFRDIINDIIATLNHIPYEQSFAASEERKLKEGRAPIAIWDHEANDPLTPEMVEPFSEKNVSWICPVNPAHKWKNTVKSVSLGYGCKRCSKRYQYTTKEWIEAATKIHNGKYQYNLVNYVNAHTKVEIRCPVHGIFTQIPSEHIAGKGCPYCAHQKFHPTESLAVRFPEIAAQWDYERNANTGFTPQNIGIDTKQKFYWHCNNGCNHSYLATIAFRVNRNSGCSICHGKQISPDTSLAKLNPALAAEWCAENDKTPFEVTPKSDYEALWKCPNPNHPPYKQKVEVRSRGVGCIYCSRRGKKHPKDYEDELHAKFPQIKILKPFLKSSERIECQCEKCGYIWQPYPYQLLKSTGCPNCKKRE
ncbi:MAG: hypothetical protein LUI04_05950 [Porphyromonadaceae bacterium]|nr:hypothetical protein [Porphyromonadaceae bacterium]